MKNVVVLLLFTMISQNPSAVIYDFTKAGTEGPWYIVDDGVMGGLSQGNIKINSDGNGVFYGFVTTKNNGGFSSAHYRLSNKDVSAFSSVVIKLKGDGKQYQFRVKSSQYQRYSYTNSFKTTGNWETIKLSFDDFIPTFRGSRLNEPNFSGKTMAEITFLIGNKRDETFSLEIEKIYLE
ncbi:CIA30 family protein [Allomuricauda sp. ARW1Y1]|jgi:hypothetical protein|uniref:CIA30 family protein n=1 Tax=Allomuricauda sp. ARW1Y1 TaxID=2663843 RepID=UPI00180387AB|nr:CIA30 family protein [Muricauda sp. ARW1Y1]NYJ29135.1 hypothetical protein [Muricauda sp. ARW1Y1]